MPIYNIHVVLMVYVYYNRIYYYLLNYYCSKHIMKHILNVFKLLLVYVCKVMQCYTITTEQQHINNNL